MHNDFDAAGEEEEVVICFYRNLDSEENLLDKSRSLAVLRQRRKTIAWNMTRNSPYCLVGEEEEEVAFLDEVVGVAVVWTFHNVVATAEVLPHPFAAELQ